MSSFGKAWIEAENDNTFEFKERSSAVYVVSITDKSVRVQYTLFPFLLNVSSRFVGHSGGQLQH